MGATGHTCDAQENLGRSQSSNLAGSAGFSRGDEETNGLIDGGNACGVYTGRIESGANVVDVRSNTTNMPRIGHSVGNVENCGPGQLPTQVVLPLCNNGDART